MSNLYRNLPPLNTLVAFEAAFRLRSFSKAADEIARSQASVSRQIRQLEENLGLVLFVRQRHDVLPTPDGDAFASTVRLVLGELSTATSRLRAKAKGRQSFTIYSDISIANALVSPILSTFQRAHPRLQLKVLSSYESIDETSEQFDIGLQVGRMAEGRFRTETIADDAIFPVCSPAFAQQLPASLDVDQLATLPLLHLENQDRGWPDWREFLSYANAKQTRLPPGLVFTTYDVCLEMAALGEGVALGWARSVQSKIDEGKLVRLGQTVMPLPDCINIYLPLLAETTPEADSFINLLKSNIVSVI